MKIKAILRGWKFVKTPHGYIYQQAHRHTAAFKHILKKEKNNMHNKFIYYLQILYKTTFTTIIPSYLSHRIIDNFPRISKLKN